MEFEKKNQKPNAMIQKLIMLQSMTDKTKSENNDESQFCLNVFSHHLLPEPSFSNFWNTTISKESKDQTSLETNALRLWVTRLLD